LLAAWLLRVGALSLRRETGKGRCHHHPPGAHPFHSVRRLPSSRLCDDDAADFGLKGPIIEI
jgi:hypothetical protein